MAVIKINREGLAKFSRKFPCVPMGGLSVQNWLKLEKMRERVKADIAERQPEPSTDAADGR